MPQEPHYGQGGRAFYGAVTVSERGQIAIPAQARRDLEISPGDKLLVLVDPDQGIALVKLEALMRQLQAGSELFRVVAASQPAHQSNPDHEPTHVEPEPQ